MAQGIAARTNAPSPKFHLALQKLVMVAACPLITKKMKSNKLILKKDHAGIAAESLTQLQEICKYIKKTIQSATNPVRIFRNPRFSMSPTVPP